MANENEIGFKINVEGTEQSISTVKDLKQAIKNLQDEAENSDFGSEQYKQAVEQLESLNEKLSEVTSSQKKLAQAEAEAQKESQDLRKQFEAMEDELFLLAGQGKQNTAEFIKLSQEAAKLNKQIDEVNQTLGGSATERAEMGYAKLQESFKKLDFKGISQGFSMLKTAIAATGVMLLVQGVQYLYENFDKLSQGSGGLAKALRFVGDIISEILKVGEEMLNWVTDTIGLTNQLERDMEAMGKAAIQSFKDSKEALKEQTEEMDRNIRVAKAMGKNTVEMEIEKQKAIIETNKQYLLQLEQMAKTRAITEEERKLIKESAKAIKDAKAEIAIIEANDQKEKDDKAKAAAEKAKAEREKRLADEKKANEEARKEWNNHLSMLSDAAIKAKQDEINQIAQIVDTSTEEENAKAAEMFQQAVGNRLETALKEQTAYAELEKEKYNITLQSLQALQNLSDIYFLFKSKNLKKGSKEEEEVAKKAFQVNKALQLSTAVVSGIQAVQNAYTTGLASPITAVFPGYPALQAVIAGVASAANIAKIAAIQFTSSASGGGGEAPSGANVPIPAPPTVSNPNANVEGTRFDEQGNRITDNKQPAIQVTATVGVDEISSKQNRVNVLEKQATF